MSRGRQYPPGSTEAIIFSEQKWKLTVDPLHVDCWSAPPPQDQQRWSLFHMKVKVDCWSSPCWSPPQDQQCDCLCIDHQLPLHWVSITSTSIINLPPGSTVLIASMLIINRLYIQHQLPLHWSLIPPRIKCWSPPRWLLIVPGLTVDRPPYVSNL